MTYYNSFPFFWDNLSLSSQAYYIKQWQRLCVWVHFDIMPLKSPSHLNRWKPRAFGGKVRSWHAFVSCPFAWIKARVKCWTQKQFFGVLIHFLWGDSTWGESPWPNYKEHIWYVQDHSSTFMNVCEIFKQGES